MSRFSWDHATLYQSVIMDLKVKLPPAQVSVDTFRNTCDMWLSGKRYKRRKVNLLFMGMRWAFDTA